MTPGAVLWKLLLGARTAILVAMLVVYCGLIFVAFMLDELGAALTRRG